MKRYRNARNRGSIAFLAFVAVVPLSAAIGGFAVDCMHVNDARGELQRATDAGALAGAEDLNNYTGTSLPESATSANSTSEEPLKFALETCSMNAVDGPIGLWSSNNRSVTAKISYDSSLGTGSASQPNRCDVDGSIYIHSLFAQIFGNFGQTVSTHSAAGLLALNEMYLPLPLLVSWNDTDPNGNALKSMPNPFTIELKDNTSSNAIWVYNNNQTDKSIVDIIGGQSVKNFTMPTPINIGDTVKADNGEKSAGKDFNYLNGKDVVFLVTQDSITSDYLAKGKPSHVVWGFMVMHVTAYDNTAGKNGYQLTGTLKQAPTQGAFNPNGTGVPSGIGTNVPYLPRLIE